MASEHLLEDGKLCGKRTELRKGRVLFFKVGGRQNALERRHAWSPPFA